MGNRNGTLHRLGLSLFRRLAGIYPDRFRRQYAGEIFAVLRQRLEDANTSGGAAMPALILQESGALIVSIIREHWHELPGRRDMTMDGDERLYHEIKAVFLKRRLKSTGRLVLMLAALIPLYYGCIYAYARIQIAQAKQMGVFATLEDAVYSLSYDELRGARVVRVDINHTEPCFPDGKLLFIWCVSSTVYYDRTPEGYHHNIFRNYSSFYQLREGWVLMAEELFPGFIGGVMEQFGLEGVDD
jgi:hypothetical protein